MMSLICKHIGLMLTNQESWQGIECYDFETHHLMTANRGVSRNYSHVVEWAGIA